jgi:hypothetical protein
LELRIFYFFDPATHRRAKSFAVSVNLPQGVVAARLRACKQAIDAFESIDHCPERLGHDFVHRKAGLFQRFVKFIAMAGVATSPLCGEIIRNISNGYKYSVDALAGRGPQKSTFQATQTKDFPSQVDNVSGQKFFDSVFRLSDSDHGGLSR